MAACLLKQTTKTYTYHQKHKDRRTTHIANDGCMSARPIKKPCTYHQKRKGQRNQTDMKQLLVAGLPNQLANHAHSITNTTKTNTTINERWPVCQNNQKNMHIILKHKQNKTYTHMTTIGTRRPTSTHSTSRHSEARR